jgi:hypothetical protein
MPIGLVSFSCAAPVASWSPSVNPARDGGYLRGLEIFQPTGFCGADLYSYDHGSKDTRTLRWEALPAADMATLEAFLATIHGFHPFTFTDYEATACAVSKILNFESFGYENLTLTLYRVTIQLEVA